MKNGFTLIELLVVISIIGVLASIVVTTTLSARAKSRDAARISDFNEFKIALELFYSAYGVYPCGDAIRPSGGTYDSSLSDPFLNGEKVGLPLAECVGSPKFGLAGAELYPSTWPKDPINTVDGYLYAYDVSADRQSYVLYASMEQNDSIMNEGGLCPALYEVGPGTGIMVPELNWLFLYNC